MVYSIDDRRLSMTAGEPGSKVIAGGNQEMADDFKVILPPSYTVRGAQSKRDHQTDNALQSLHQRNRRQQREEQHDRCEFSTGTPDSEEGTQQDPRQEPEPSPPVVYDLPQAPPPNHIPDSPDTDDTPPPGSMLDVEA